jgi:hypothetical protein
MEHIGAQIKHGFLVQLCSHSICITSHLPLLQLPS